MNKTKKGIAVLTLAGMLGTVAPVCALAETVQPPAATEQEAAAETAAEETQAAVKVTLAKDSARAGAEELQLLISREDSKPFTKENVDALQVWAERVPGEVSGFDKVALALDEEGRIVASVTSGIMGQVVLKAAWGESLDAARADKEALLGEVDGTFTGTATMNIGQKSFTFNDKTIPLDVAPFIQNGRTLVPIRALSEACGATVVYDQKMETISISLGADVIKMKLGAANMEKNGKVLSNDAVPQVTAEGRAVLPFRAIAEALDFTVEALTDADGSVRAVTFTNVEAAPTEAPAEKATTTTEAVKLTPAEKAETVTEAAELTPAEKATEAAQLTPAEKAEGDTAAKADDAAPEK